MKNVKKLLSILVVLTLVLSLGASAFAATITIDGAAPDHTYVAYQVFSGTTATIDGAEKLASIQWANEAGAAALLTALADDDTIGSNFNKAGMTAEEAAEAMGKLTTAEQKQALARVLADNADSLGSGVTIVSGETNLDPGYYAIVDTTPVEGANDSKNAIVLEVVGTDVVVNNKRDVPEAEKKVQDRNDTTGGANTGWQDGADWDIGDSVPFQITGTLPSNLNEYETYELIFHDKQSDGLTFDPDSVHVYVDGKEITTGFEIKTSGFEDDCTFEIVFENIKNVAGADNSVDVVVTYNSTLNNEAVIGGSGNPNEMQMEFSNNPGGEGTGKTPWDKVTVFTFALDVLKVDEDTDALAGAAFTLFKSVPAPSEYPEGQPYTSLESADGEPIALEKGDYYQVGDTVYQVVGVTEAGTATNFEFKGLDDGDYLLIETTVPDGYNKADDITFTVTDTHTEDDGNSNKQDMGTLSVKVTSGDAEITVTEETGHLSTTVVNNSGLTLPETGGIGTTIFYVVGAILVAGAVILLVTRKRMSTGK